MFPAAVMNGPPQGIWRI